LIVFEPAGRIKSAAEELKVGLLVPINCRLKNKSSVPLSLLADL
jgi:hypothetical protein